MVCVCVYNAAEIIKTKRLTDISIFFCNSYFRKEILTLFLSSEIAQGEGWEFQIYWGLTED